MFRGYGTCTSVAGHRNLLTQEIIKELSGSGLEYIEISALQTLHFDIHNKRHLENIGRALRQNKLKVWSVHAPFTPFAMEDKATRQEGIELAVETCSLNKYFEFDKIVLHPGSDTLTGNRIQEMKNLKAALTEIIERTGKIKIALETMGHYTAGTAAELLEVLKGRDPKKAGVCVDTGHTLLVEDVAGAIRKLKGRIFTVHIQDNDGKKDLHRVPFTGIIKWKEVKTALLDSGYDGVFMFECGLPGSGLKETLKQMRLNYKKILEL